MTTFFESCQDEEIFSEIRSSLSEREWQRAILGAVGTSRRRQKISPYLLAFVFSFYRGHFAEMEHARNYRASRKKLPSEASPRGFEPLGEKPPWGSLSERRYRERERDRAHKREKRAWMVASLLLSSSPFILLGLFLYYTFGLLFYYTFSPLSLDIHLTTITTNLLAIWLRLLLGKRDMARDHS